ncbi:MAG: hypothetical protein KDE45_15035 [Caldilineaceae bacterium]|nr:hypothetical protein [Caldilineaceae bacterium]
MNKQFVTLRDMHDEGGHRSLAASLAEDGTLTITGQDLGDGVEQFFGPGNREYEWVWTIRAQHVPQLAAALGAGDDLLAALAARFSDERAAGLQPFLDEQAIPYDHWSRVGD